MARWLIALTALIGCLEVSPAPPPPRPGEAPGLGHLERLVHEHANRSRQRLARPALTWDSDLAAIARAHSRDMAQRGFFAHETPDGRSPQDRAQARGILCQKRLGGGRMRVGIAENLYLASRYARVRQRETEAGRETAYDWNSGEAIAAEATGAWLQSASHRRNLLDPHVRSQGIGVSVGPDHRVFITQILC